MFKDVTDNELLYLIRCDNVEAKNYLIERYSKRIYGFIDSFRERNCIKELDYEECYSICWITFLSCLDSYENGNNFAFYVSGAINNALMKYWKKEAAKRKTYSIEYDTNDYILYKSDCVSDGGITYYDDSVAQYLNKNLDEKEKQMVEYLLQGYSGVEVAKLTKMSYKKYSHKICKIRELIRQKF